MSIVWFPDPETGAFTFAHLERSSKYKSLVSKTTSDVLRTLATKLTEVADNTPCTRWNLLITRGQCLRDRKAKYLEVLHNELGDVGRIVDYKVVGVNSKAFERGGVHAMMGAMFFPLSPAVWIKFGLLS